MNGQLGAIAKEVGIDEVIAGVLPYKKAQITSNKNKNKVKLPLLDGSTMHLLFNDSDVGIAMGAGSDIAIELAGSF